MGRDNISKGLLVGFLTGGIVGAAVALLYAPKSGKELRQDIREKAGELTDEAEKFLENAKVKASEMINEGKIKSEQLITDAKSKAQELLRDTEKVISDAKSNINSETGRVRDAVKAGMDTYKDAKNETTV